MQILFQFIRLASFSSFQQSSDDNMTLWAIMIKIFGNLRVLEKNIKSNYFTKLYPILFSLILYQLFNINIII